MIIIKSTNMIPVILHDLMMLIIYSQLRLRQTFFKILNSIMVNNINNSYD
jgi:hypothetical protein